VSRRKRTLLCPEKLDSHNNRKFAEEQGLNQLPHLLIEQLDQYWVWVTRYLRIRSCRDENYRTNGAGQYNLNFCIKLKISILLFASFAALKIAGCLAWFCLT
jgi:hypothetical protein